MKAYKAIPDQSLRLFRPDLNMARLKRSMERLQMPGFDFDPNELIECIKILVKQTQDWVPYGEGYSLYLRPNCIAMNCSLGLSVPDSVLLYVVSTIIQICSSKYLLCHSYCLFLVQSCPFLIVFA